MWDSKADRFGQQLGGPSDFVDFARADFFTAAIDDLFESAGDADVAFARPSHLGQPVLKPAMGKRLCVCFVVVLITRCHVSCPESQFRQYCPSASKSPISTP
jgi:hypothetical protein